MTAPQRYSARVLCWLALLLALGFVAVPQVQAAPGDELLKLYNSSDPETILDILDIESDDE